MKDALGAPQSVLVLGGASDIALATARTLVRNRTRTVVLAARRPSDLDAAVKELRDLGAATVEAVPFDAADTASHQQFVDDTFSRFGDFDVVLFAFGLLGDQEESNRNNEAATKIAYTNYVGSVSVGVPIANRMRAQGHGTIVALSSVAGERARKANYTYGSSKAGMDAWFQGLGDDLAGTGVHVMIVRPGFVHTKMTEGMNAAPLSTTPEAVADAIANGIARNSNIVWVPGPLRFVMSVLRHMPRAVYRRLPIS
ncbi:MAG: decaprenylphospho-beta-D-erythro-pentofuranosid-2-ulose 2-reductase [Acidimicrobiia bacterium]